MTNPNPAKSTQKQLRSLVAEDNEINQKLIQRILQTAGYEVDMVDNGREAVEFASRNHYDFILMDLQMPLMDGYEATKRIRNAECGMRNSNRENSDSNSTFPIFHSKFQKVPIIALTGSNPGAKMEKCLGLGMNDCIGKPLSRDQLLSLINRWTTTESVGSDCGKAQKKVGEPIAENTSARQPIDLDRALNEFMGEKKVLNGILNEFTTKVRSQIRSIRQAFLSLDFSEIAKEAHSIKGGAANLTANKVAGMASALEKAADLQQVDLVKNLAGELEDQFQLLENYLQCQLPLA
jgi:CheY-like chemotaxis protein/HPt (histidine-containing phosphotransfer) domain-containing protein